MEKTKEQQAILNRVEEIYKDTGLSKSKFAAAFGMRPQTYNNFIGAQGSKPNVPLVYGVSSAYNVYSDWLLFGTGQKYRPAA